MNATAKILTYELQDVLRSRGVIAYAVFFLLLTEALLQFGSSTASVLLSLMNVVLLLLPLVSLVFGTMYLYNARDFVELLLSQPIRRPHLFGGLYLGLAVPLATGFLAGTCLPFLWHGVEAASHAQTLLVLALTGTALTFIFVALAFLIAVRFEDKARGLGVALVVWLFLAVLYDGLVLLALHMFANYPLETPALVLTLLNPVDLARVLLLLQVDISALMGYTGAVFERFFGSLFGVGVASAALLVWLAVPLFFGLRRFNRKDF